MPTNPVVMPAQAGWRFDHSYARLPASLHARTLPTRVREPRLVVFNRPLGLELGLDVEALDQPGSAALFAGNVLPDGAEPLAQAYAGHQYGNFTVLGDGRAILLGEQLTPSGARFDVQLKGSGPTPFSRRGDGRAALGPMLREFVVSEAMHALGIPTTRSLAVVATGEPVFRESPLPGAVLTRIAASHIRVGTFEWAAARGDLAALRALADHTVSRHYPELADAPEPHPALLRAVIDRQAQLIARWLLVGFVHGVMNTDNMALSGETIDYGPCAFLDAYVPGQTFSSIDHHGRYAYANQPQIAQWNLARLAEAMLPLLHADESRALDLANAWIEEFPRRFQRHWLDGMRAKLGLFGESPGDADLVRRFLDAMEAGGNDFTNTFRDLSTGNPAADAAASSDEFRSWHRDWQARLAAQPQSPEAVRRLMRAHNPAVIPRNHLVEAALEAATLSGYLGPLRRLLVVLKNPFDHDRDLSDHGSPPPPGSPVYRTFCGT